MQRTVVHAMINYEYVSAAMTESIRTGQWAAEDFACCALDEGHEGPCAWKCSECFGTQRCRECGDRSMDDLGGCGECGGAGGCSYCYEGWISDE